jgi:hypothetical protein
MPDYSGVDCLGRMTEYIDGKRVRRQIKSLDTALLMYQLCQIAREEEYEARYDWAREREGLEAITAKLDAFSRGVADLVAWELGRLGFHRPKRGEWRVSREVFRVSTTNAMKDRLLAQAIKGTPAKKRAAVAQVKQDYPDLYEFNGDMAQICREGLLQLLSGGGKNALVAASLAERLERMQRELLSEDPTALERLLVEEVILSWMHLQHADLLHTNAQRGESFRFSALEYYQRRLVSAQRRYLAAVTTLERVKALMRPVISVQRLAILSKAGIALVESEQALVGS